MPQSYFIWKDKDCRQMGVTLKSPLPIIRPEERVEHITIPGRPGDLTRIEGEDVFNSYIHTASISVQDAVHVRDVYAWLRGEGYLISSSEPDRRQRARIIGAVTLDKVSRNLDRWTGEVQFYCQPLKEKLYETPVSVTTAYTEVNNDGDVNSKPLYKITASDSTTILKVNGDNNAMTITGMQSGWVFYIDSDRMEVLDTNGDLMNTSAIGVFPVMKPGKNVIYGGGWSAVEITKRERFL